MEVNGMIFQLQDIDKKDIYPQTVASAVIDERSGKTITQLLEDIEVGIINEATNTQINSLFE